MAIRARSLAGLGSLLAILLCVACATVPPVQLAFMPGAGGEATGRPLPCSAQGVTIGEPNAASLPGPLLRVLSWNLHKNGDPGWDDDLARFAGQSDIVLIQEASLTASLQAALATAGYAWILAASFELGGTQTGVLSAARVAPLAACVQRSIEPLLQLPKAALIARYAVKGADTVLAVANLHAINFTLGLADYRAQLDGLALELDGHRGPIIVGGDFNTWSEVRLEAVREFMQRLRLVAVLPSADERTRVLGKQIDFVFVRGLDVVDVRTPQVGSSDHNPMLATLRMPPR